MNRRLTQQTSFRLPVSLLVRLDQLARAMTEARPGIAVTRADVVRMLLLRGLESESIDQEVTT